MKLKLSPTILAEIDPAIEDAVARQAHPERYGPLQRSDGFYLKVHAATETRRGCVIDADLDDLAEIVDRAEYVLECIVPEQLEWRADRAYGLALLNAYRALLRQIAKRKAPTERGRPSGP